MAEQVQLAVQVPRSQIAEIGDLDAVVGEDHDELRDGDVIGLEEQGEMGVLDGLDVEANRIGTGSGRQGRSGIEGVAA